MTHLLTKRLRLSSVGTPPFSSTCDNRLEKPPHLENFFALRWYDEISLHLLYDPTSFLWWHTLTGLIKAVTDRHGGFGRRLHQGYAAAGPPGGCSWGRET